MKGEKAAVIRQIRGSDISTTLGDADVELKNVMLLAEMVQQEEDALSEYITTVREMSSVKLTATHYEL